MNRSSKIFVELALEGYSFQLRPKSDWYSALSYYHVFFLLQEFTLLFFIKISVSSCSHCVM